METRQAVGRVLPTFVWEKLAAHPNQHTIASRIFLLVYVHGEVDGAHDAITKFFVDQLLDGLTVDPDNLIPAIDNRICGHSLIP